jgi:glycosyltransferase involved in cell wall biosynthesis
MERVAFIIKYFPKSSKRISGLTSFACLLFEKLALKLEVHVFSECSEKYAHEWSENHAYTLHPVKGPFWLRVGYEVASSAPHCVIILSGLHKARFIFPVFCTLLHSIQDIPNKFFYQCVNLDGPPGWLACRLLARFDRLIGTNYTIRSHLSRALPEHCTYLPPGIDLGGISNAPVTSKSAPIRIGYFNHLNKTKGCDIAIDAFLSSPFNDTEFVIAGTGDMADILNTKYDGNDGIKFLGYLPDPIPDMKACDMILLPFRTHVSVLGISQTALECLACGVPVIASDNESITTLIRDEQEGLIYNHPEQLGEKILRLHDDVELRKRLSQNAIRHAEEFKIETVSDKLYQMICQDIR